MKNNGRFDDTPAWNGTSMATTAICRSLDLSGEHGSAQGHHPASQAPPDPYETSTCYRCPAVFIIVTVGAIRRGRGLAPNTSHFRQIGLTQSIDKPGLHTDRDYCFALLLRKLFTQSSSSSVRPRTLRMLVIDLSGLLIRLSCRIAQEKSTRTGPDCSVTPSAS